METSLGSSQVNFQVLKRYNRHGIMYSSEKDDPWVIRYVDLDYPGDMDDRGSTTRYVFTLIGGPICKNSYVQSIVVMSTIEAAYMAVAKATKEALWLTWLVNELSVEKDGVQLHCDLLECHLLGKN